MTTYFDSKRYENEFLSNHIRAKRRLEYREKIIYGIINFVTILTITLVTSFLLANLIEEKCSVQDCNQPAPLVNPIPGFFVIVWCVITLGIIILLIRLKNGENNEEEIQHP